MKLASTGRGKISKHYEIAGWDLFCRYVDSLYKIVALSTQLLLWPERWDWNNLNLGGSNRVWGNGDEEDGLSPHCICRDIRTCQQVE